MNRGGRSLVLVLALALVMVMGFAGLAAAAPGGATVVVDDGTQIQIGRDAYVAPGETVDTVMAVGGNVTVAGTVRTVAVAIGGDVRIESGATVGGAMTPDDVVVVAVGGQIVTQPGARVMGRTMVVTDGVLDDLFDGGFFFGAHGLFSVSTIVGGWLAFTLFFVMFALLATLILPRQITLVRDQVSRAFWPSLGWGALIALIVIPLGSVLLLVTVVGILALVPALFIALPLVVFFGFVGVGTLVGGRLVAALGGRRDNLILAGVVGVAVLGLLNLVPVLGGLLLGVVWMVGLGAIVLAIRDARRRRKAALGAQAGTAAVAPQTSAAVPAEPQTPEAGTPPAAPTPQTAAAEPQAAPPVDAAPTPQTPLAGPTTPQTQTEPPAPAATPATPAPQSPAEPQTPPTPATPETEESAV
jgi:hypothetical protein